MSRYIYIRDAQSPFDAGLDENRRPTYSSNFRCRLEGESVDLGREIAKVLEDSGLGTLGFDIFIGSSSIVPQGDGPYSTIIDTAGLPTLESMGGDRFEMPSFQVLTRATSLVVARDRSLEIHRRLRLVRDEDITV